MVADLSSVESVQSVVKIDLRARWLMSGATRNRGLAGRAGYPAWIVCVLFAIGCPSVGSLRADPPAGDPERERAVALVGRLGGKVEHDENSPGRPIREILLSATRVADDQLGELLGLSALRKLDLIQTRISDAGLARLRGHEGLRILFLYDTKVTDRGFEHIATLSGLEWLIVGLCDVTGSGLSHLASLKNLKWLRLMDLEITDPALAPLARLGQLEQLDLLDLRITDAGLAHLRGLARLRRLRLDGNAVTDAGLAHLSGLSGLEELSLEGTRVTDSGLVHLEALPHLKRLRHGGTKITAAGLGRLPHLDRSPAAAVAGPPKPPEARSEPVEVAKPVQVTPDRIRSAVTRALPPLEKSLVVYAEKRDCFSCHNQAVPLVALEIVRTRGLAIDEDAFQGAVALTLADLDSALVTYRNGRGQPGGVTRAAYALWTLEAGKYPTDEVTAAVAGYLLKADLDRGHWTTSSRRPPMEASHFTTTALALRALRYYGARSQAGLVDDRARRARSWLSTSRPADTEDRVFRLWGLKYADATPAELGAAARDLLAAQRDDGGWAQTDKLASDAYATGSALVALHQAARLSTDDPAYRRGVAFLLRTQKPDGTWFVASRSQPFQLYFESGFPYGKDQFIAVAASGWAAAALALALPAKP
jgi:hypothetical protein